MAAFLRAFEQGQQIADTDRAAAELALLCNDVVPSRMVAATMTLPSYPLAMDIPEITRMIQPEAGEVG